MDSYNIKFPLVDDKLTNKLFKTNKLTKNGVSSDLLLLLLTRKGERYYNPEYGTNLLKYVFEQNTNLTALDIENEIKRVVKRYIPSLTIDSVTFNWNFDDEGNPISDNQLNVNIKFTYNEDAFSESSELDINF